MAQNDITLSNLTAAADLPAGTLFYVAVENQQSETGYDSLKITSEMVGSKLLSTYNFPALFDTTAKNAAGAINELAARPTPTIVTGTLAAHTTSITISNAAILDNSVIQIFTDPLVPVLSAVVPSGGGSITITFDEQSTSVGITLLVW